MPRFLIRREIAGAGAMSAEDLRNAARTSCHVLGQIGPQIQWVHSYVTDDTIHCIYLAPDASLIRQHAREAGFPADEVLEIRAVIDPTTAEVHATAEA